MILTLNLVSADTQSITMKFIVPEEDTTAPTINCQDYTGYIGESFSKYLSASDVSGIDSYILNDTSIFNINIETGLITNVTLLNSLTTYNLNASVNDTLGNTAYCEFKITIINRVVSDVICIKNRFYYNYLNNHKYVSC